MNTWAKAWAYSAPIKRSDTDWAAEQDGQAKNEDRRTYSENIDGTLSVGQALGGKATTLYKTGRGLASQRWHSDRGESHPGMEKCHTVTARALGAM